MPSYIKSVTFDAVDALALATFWAADDLVVMRDPEGNEFCVE